MFPSIEFLQGNKLVIHLFLWEELNFPFDLPHCTLLTMITIITITIKGIERTFGWILYFMHAIFFLCCVQLPSCPSPLVGDQPCGTYGVCGVLVGEAV